VVLAFFEAVGAGWAFPERYAKALEAVTPADVAAGRAALLSSADHRRPGAPER